MKKFILAIALINGLVLPNNLRAEGSKGDHGRSDSSACSAAELATLESIAVQASEAAELLLHDPLYATPEQRSEAEMSREFEMRLISTKAGAEASLIQALLEK